MSLSLEVNTVISLSQAGKLVAQMASRPMTRD